jgi:hypothetical protein
LLFLIASIAFPAFPGWPKAFPDYFIGFPAFPAFPGFPKPGQRRHSTCWPSLITSPSQCNAVAQLAALAYICI